MRSIFGRARSIAVALVFTVIAMSVAGCGRGEEPKAKSAPTKKKISLGKAYAKDPDPKKLVKTKNFGEVPANQIAVVFEEGSGKKEAESLAKKLEGAIVGEIEYVNLFQIETEGKTEADLTAALEEASKQSGVDYAFANAGLSLSRRIEGISHNPLKEDSYSEGENGRQYEMIGLKNAWDIIKASGVKTNDVTMGIADEPINSDSEELNIARADGKVQKGKTSTRPIEAIDATKDPAKDKQGKIKSGGLTHGTQVAHTMAADPDDGGVLGVTGVLGEKAHVINKNVFDAGDEMVETAADPNDPTKVAWGDGKSYTIKTLVHLKKLVEEGATVINCSFNYEPNANLAAQAAAYRKFLMKLAKDHPKVLIVASAGNYNTAVDGTNDIFGQKLPNLVTVGALDNDGVSAEFSNYATGNGEVTLSAPGVGVPVGVGPDGKTVVNSGTSFAAPQVTGAVALIQSINPDLSAAEIKKILVDTASDTVTGPDLGEVYVPSDMGAGVLRVDNAVLKVINDMRAKQKLPALNKTILLAMSGISLYAEGEGTSWTAVAGLKAVSDKGTTVKIRLSGEGSFSGNSSKKLESAGNATWKVTLIKGKSCQIRVTRLDTGAWAYVDLDGGEGTDGKASGASGTGANETSGGASGKPASGAMFDAMSGRSKIAVKVGGDFAYSDPQYSGKDITITNYPTSGGPYGALTWNGTTMSGSYSVQLGPEHNNQKIDITINAAFSKDGKKIQSLTAKRRNYGVDAQGYNWEEVKELKLTNIPLASYGGPTQPVFQVRGSPASASAGTVTHTFTTGNPVLKSYTLNSINWGSATYQGILEVNFYK
ncbi:MAG: S8 family peptidase [Candidatus Aquicultorales bacterium]